MKKLGLCLLIIVAAIAGWFSFRSAPAALGSAAERKLLNTVPMGWSVNERAIQTLQEKLKRDPENADHRAALGHAYLQKARETGDPTLYAQADVLFDQVLRNSPTHTDAEIGRASLALSRHEFEQARDIALRVIARTPNLATPYGVLTDALVELGDYEEAIRAADRMASLKPNLSSYSRISYLRELMGDVEGAESAMRMAVEAGAPDAENTAWCIVQLGNLYLNSGRAELAELAFNAALERFPNYVHALAGLARVHVSRGKFESAADLYQRAAQRVPLPEFLIGLAEVYERTGQKTEASRQHELLTAIEEIYRANDVQIDGDLALFETGRNPERGLAMARAEWDRRKSVKVADTYAWALFRAGKLHEASEIMAQARRLGTKDPLMLFHASQIAQAMGRVDEARALALESARLNPGIAALYAEARP